MRSMQLVVIGAILAMAACAPVPDSGNPVYLEAVTPNARAARDAELRASPGGPSGTSGLGEAPADPMRSAAEASAGASTFAPGRLTDDSTYRGGPVAAEAGPSAGIPYQPVAPAPVPERPADGEPSIVAFALATSHPVGQSQYSRSYVSEARTQRACARYASADQAQTAFLESGGPQRDAQGLDPDGDGYACGWTPDPFRRAVGRG